MTDHYEYLANLVGCLPEQVMFVSPDEFAVSSWEYLGMYQSAQEVRECLMEAWRKRGINTACPVCGRYANKAFFLTDGKYPVAFECEYDRLLFGNAPEQLMTVKASEEGLRYPPMGEPYSPLKEWMIREIRGSYGL